MFSNRLFNVFVVLALAAVIFFTAREGMATTALVNADRDYDQVEQVRAERVDANLQTDRSYDVIEAQRLVRSLPLIDRSYDQVEALRIERHSNAPVADRSYDAIEAIRATRTYGK